MSIDLRQFHAAFFEESLEAVTSMEQALLQLDAVAPDPEAIHTIFRVAHSVKGGAATFGFGEISSFTHSLENLLDLLRAGRMSINVGLMELLLRSVDVMRELLNAQQSGKSVDAQRMADLQLEIEQAAMGSAAEPVASAPSPQAKSATHYRIHFRPLPQLLTRRNDPLRLFRELAELGRLAVESDVSALPPLASLDPECCYISWRLTLEADVARETVLEVFDWAIGDCELEVSGGSSAASSAPRPAEIPAASASAAAPASPADRVRPAPAVQATPAAESGSIRVSVEKIDDLMNSVGELVITQSMLTQFAPLLSGAGVAEQLRAGLATLERNVRELQESVMRVRMVPISFVFGRFPRMVRDLGQRLGKQVELKLTGGDTELDKTVLEKIADPLVHLIRNSIDHGIETPAERRAAGKGERGCVHLHAYHRGSSIRVEVSDDGAGLKGERILAKARERGLIGGNERLSDDAVHNLIFLPGFSTVEQTTDVSGRGVGMDVVKRNVEALGGSIDVRSVPGQGACFAITLPLTLAIIDGQTVTVGPESYIVPLTAIVESLQLDGQSIKRVVGHGEVLGFRGEYLPVLRLDEWFGSPAAALEPAERQTHAAGLVMVVEGEGRRVGLLVDALLGQQQVVVKTLETNYGHVEGIAGATILGNGAVALILDVAGLTRSAAERQVA